MLWVDRPILCLVTDRARLTTWSPDDARSGDCILRQVTWAREAGVNLIQLREPDLEARALTGLAVRAVAATRGSKTRLLVNDRLDVALAAGADGVHLRGDSIPVADVRRLAPRPFLVGRSVHSAPEAISVATHGDVDYLIFGSVFGTSSKPAGHPVAGVAALASVVGAVGVPVFAIGGLSRETSPEVARTGAAGLAGIGLFMGEAGAACRAVPLLDTVAAVRRAFDSARGLS